MNYRLQALILGLALLAGGIFVLVDVTLQYQTILSQSQTLPESEASAIIVQASIIAFMGLGLVLSGSLIMFAAPQPLVASDIVGRVSSPSAKNLAMIINGLPTKSHAIHVPRVELGGESLVLLLYTSKNPVASSDENHHEKLVADWKGTRKVLEPAGIELMRGYERTLRRDFFGLDLEQLGHHLSKAIVPEFQLCSGFSLRESSANTAEATWTKPAVSHTCIEQGGVSHPELCSLCSSVACALAKASGKMVWIERSESTDSGLRVVTTYRLMGE